MQIRGHFLELERTFTRFYSLTRLLKSSADRIFIPILVYHEICNQPHEIGGFHSYNVTPSAFKNQMKFLYENNYSVIKLEEFILCLSEKKELPHRSVVITFDDGYKNNYTNAFEILRQYNFPATIFLVTDYIGTNKIFPWFESLSNNDQKIKECWMPLSWAEVAKMSKDNVTFGSHTCTHSNIRRISENDFEAEIKRSKSTIEDKINLKVDLFSYSFSFPKYRKAYQSIVNASRRTLQDNNFLGACTTLIGTNSQETDPFCLRRIQIKNNDKISQFNAKLEGAYNWASLAQKLYQKFFEHVFEKKNTMKVSCKKY